LAANESPSAADREKALEKLKAAHYSFETQQLVQWTMNTIPGYAEEPYVQMAAYLAADDFEAPGNPAWLSFAMMELQRAVNLPAVESTPAVYF
jgi:hypothetical protein